MNRNCLYLCLCLCLPALAQPPGVGDGPPKRPGPWSVGVGGIFKSSPYKGGENRLLAIPMIAYRGERLRVFGPGAEYVLRSGEKSELALELKLDFEGYDEDDSDALEGLGDRQITLNAGVSGDIDVPAGFSLKGGLLRDVLSRHDGWIAEASVGRSFKRRGDFIRPAVFLRWFDDKYTDYYFGVSPSKARADRPAYDPSDGAVYGLSLTARKQLRGPWSVMSRVGVNWLSSELKNSPVVSRDYEWGMMAGVVRGL